MKLENLDLKNGTVVKALEVDKRNNVNIGDLLVVHINAGSSCENVCHLKDYEDVHDGFDIPEDISDEEYDDLMAEQFDAHYCFSYFGDVKIVK